MLEFALHAPSDGIVFAVEYAVTGRVSDWRATPYGCAREELGGRIAKVLVPRLCRDVYVFPIWHKSNLPPSMVRIPRILVHPFRLNSYTDSGVFVHPGGGDVGAVVR